MGPIILVFIVALLIILLALPAIRARFGNLPPPEDRPEGEEPHEVVVRRLDDHRKKKSPGDDTPKG